MDPKTFHKVSYGLYVISSLKEKQFNGQIANTVFQISSDPATIAVSINKNNLTHEFIKESKVFTVSILSQNAPMNLIGNFGFKSGRELEKFKEASYKIGTTGAPILLDHTLGYMEAELINSIDVETHTVFIGKVIEGEILNNEEPMTYAYYHQVKRGTAPKTAPTYIEEKTDEIKNEISGKKYKCSVCGYIYDPAKGDPDSGIAPGTAFEDIPDDWVCPICGVSKDQFEAME